MSTDTQNRVSSAIRGAALDAGKAASEMPRIDTDGILRGATQPGASFRPWIARSAGAAAVLAAAIGAFMLLRPGVPADVSSNGQPIPLAITAMVDSLYSHSDYVHDELAELMWPAGRTDENNYLEDVWDSVITNITDR